MRPDPRTTAQRRPARAEAVPNPLRGAGEDRAQAAGQVLPFRRPAAAPVAWQVSHFVSLDGAAWPVFRIPPGS